MTRIRQVAPLLHIINFNNLCFLVENETTLISAKNRIDLSSISEVRSYITEWPRFFGPPCITNTKVNLVFHPSEGGSKFLARVEAGRTHLKQVRFHMAGDAT